MPKKNKLSAEQSQEIVAALKGCKEVKIYKRLKALEMKANGSTSKEISEVVGLHAKYIPQLVRKYINNGLKAITEDGRTSNNRNLTLEEETEFLQSFIEAAEKGQIITVSEIRKAYDELIGKNSGVRTIYTLLHRHGWRKIMPRSKHPKKASEEVIEASKKLSLNTTN